MSTHTPLTELQQLDEYLSTGRVPKKSKSVIRADHHDHLSLKDKLMKELKDTHPGTFAAMCHIYDDNGRDLLTDLGLELVVSLFAESSDPTISTQFRADMKEMGFQASDAMKIFLELVRLYKAMHKDGRMEQLIPP